MVQKALLYLQGQTKQNGGLEGGRRSRCTWVPVCARSLGASNMYSFALTRTCSRCGNQLLSKELLRILQWYTISAIRYTQEQIYRYEIHATGADQRRRVSGARLRGCEKRPRRRSEQAILDSDFEIAKLDNLRHSFQLVIMTSGD